MKTIIHTSAGTLASFLFALTAQPVAGQSSTYLANPDNSDYSGMTASGGTILVSYEMIFGTPPPPLGPQFNVAITVSAITSYVPGVTYTWTTTAPDPILGLIGLNYPADVLETLPASNQTSLPLTVGGVTLDPGVNTRLWMEANLAEGNLQFLGEFTLTLSAIPFVPGYEAPTQLSIWSESHSMLVDGANVLAGFWATMGPPYNEGDIEGSTRITEFDTNITYRFTGFSDGTLLPVTNTTPMWNYGGLAQFEPIPEPSTYALLGTAALGACVILRPRRRKLRVPV